jgi:hypothetical protein
MFDAIGKREGCLCHRAFQFRGCKARALQEEPLGTIINLQTRMPFTDSDSCVGRNPHVAYSATSTHAAEDAIKALLKTVFKLN